MTSDEEPVAPHRPGRVLAWLSLLGTAAVAVAVALRWLNTSAARLPVVQAAFPLVGVAAALWACFSVVLHRRRPAWAVPAVVVALVPLTLALPAYRATTVPPSGDDEVVAASNLEFGEAEAAGVVDRVRSLEVDTLVLTELTPEAAERLDDAGLTRLLPHRVGTPQPGADGTVILSRHRLTPVWAVHVPGLFDQPVATVHAPSGDYVLRAMHPYPPTPDLVRAWHRQLGEATSWVAEQPDDVPLVLAGDLNSSHGHPAFRRLADGMVDSHRAAGSGWVRTWPQDRRLPAFVQLDHVLVRDGQVVDAGAAVVEGTDHALVWSRLRLR